MPEAIASSDVSGTERAAILLMSLGEAEAAEVLKHMAPKDVQKVGQAMAALSNVSRDRAIHVMDSFVQTLNSQTSLGVGADGYIRKMLTNARYFAFTATPKATTLEKFGVRQPDGSFKPFHLYSMKQAIEEGFILNVLANYTTYKSYYEIQKSVEENPLFDTKKAQKQYGQSNPGQSSSGNGKTPKRVYDKAANGNDYFQIWSVVLAYTIAVIARNTASTV